MIKNAASLALACALMAGTTFANQGGPKLGIRSDHAPSGREDNDEGGPPVITSAQLNSDGTQLSITGKDFGTSPTIAFGASPATVVSSSTTSVVITIPPGVGPGSYLLRVTDGTGRSGSFTVAIGAQGVQGPSGPQGPTGPGGVNGVREYFASGTFTVPANITHVEVQMWGAGGGAAAPAPFSPCDGVFVNGGGGGGAYTLDVVSVTPGATYNVVVGAGGLVGGGATNGLGGTNGGNGGDTQFTSGSMVLTYAGGGQGGYLEAAAGGHANPNAMISHDGYPFVGGVGVTSGAAPYAFSLAPTVSVPAGLTSSLISLGTGGLGGTCGGTNGLPGYVLLRW